MEKTKKIGHITAAFTVFIWGLTFISTKVLLQDFSPIEILFYRFSIVFLALLVIYPRLLGIKTLKLEILFAAAGLCGVTLYFLMENIALTMTSASNVGVIVSIAPMFTALFTYFSGEKEVLNKNFFIGFFAAIVGIALISFTGQEGVDFNLTGDLLAFGASIVWGIYAVLTKKIGQYKIHTIQSTRRIFFYGLLFMIPALFVLDFQFDVTRFVQPINFLNMAFLGLIASAICFATWGYAVKLIGAVKTSVYIYMVPVVTIIASVVILHEQLTWITFIGTLLTISGLVLSERRN